MWEQFSFSHMRGMMVLRQLHNFQKSERQRAPWCSSCCAAVHTQLNFSPWSCLSSALPAAVKSRAVPWLLRAPARQGHTWQPARHTGYGGTSTKHTCMVLLWFHRYPQLLSFKRHEINGLTSDIQRRLFRIYLFWGNIHFCCGNSFSFSVQ